jgi:hypothetical protein
MQRKTKQDTVLRTPAEYHRARGQPPLHCHHGPTQGAQDKHTLQPRSPVRPALKQVIVGFPIEVVPAHAPSVIRRGGPRVTSQADRIRHDRRLHDRAARPSLARYPCGRHVLRSTPADL